MTSDVLTEVLTAIASVTGKDRESLSDATVIELLELDSLDQVEVLMFLEERFDVELDQVQVNGCKTLGDIAALVTKYKTRL